MTLFINGKSAVHKDSGGIVSTVSVNYTPPMGMPMSFLNCAYTRDACNTAGKVFVNQQGICHQSSYLFPSHGDEGGSMGGIFSGTVNGKATFLSGSPDVFIEDNPAVHAGNLMTSNQYNTQAAPLLQYDTNKGNKMDSLSDNITIRAKGDQLIRWQHNLPQKHPTGLTIVCGETG